MVEKATPTPPSPNKSKRKHPLNFVQTKGLLAEALGISDDDSTLKTIEMMVEAAVSRGDNTRTLFNAVGELEISDEMWANFLYTFGWWDGRRHE
jgi:hypothetical protein